MEENLVEVMQMQREKNIEKFKRMSSKYVQEEKVSLWHKYVDNYYDSDETNEHSMAEIFNYIEQLTINSNPQNVAVSFMRRSSSFAHASIAAKTIAFFAKRGKEFYKELSTLAEEENKEDIVDNNFANRLSEIDACEDIDEALPLLNVKTANISIGEYEDISALCFENGFIKGLTKDNSPVIGEKIDNQYAFYIINKDSSYERFLIHDPNSTHLNKKKQTKWGFVTNNKGDFLSSIKEEPKIEYT
ncbi:MAG: hypothetical protein K2L98_02745, partial [Bacilli bacterium]|nr:hypothetical protein [Bacilli bacterium]